MRKAGNEGKVDGGREAPDRPTRQSMPLGGVSNYTLRLVLTLVNVLVVVSSDVAQTPPSLGGQQGPARQWAVR